MLEPTRITLARQRAGLSTFDLARKLGTCRDTAARYETSGAPDTLAAALSRATECAPSYLRLTPAAPVDVERIFFRTPRRIGTAQKSAAGALARSGVELYALITESFTLPATEVPDYTGMDPLQAADRLRLDWNLGAGAIPDFMYVLESRGVRVLSGPLTFSFWDDGQAFIFLAPGSEDVQRHQLAHELGHLLLHSALGEAPDCAAERAAELFATRLLVPSVAGRVTDELSLPRLHDVARHFGAPAPVILDLARTEGLLGEQTYRWLCQELALDPGQLQGSVSSKVFSLVFPTLRRENRTGTAALARRLGLSSRQLHELTFGQALLVLSGGDQAGQPQAHLRAL